MDLTLILTEDCNLRCIYCYQKQFRATSLPVETGVAAVRQALAQGCPTLALTFFGGEPLLQADSLFAILEAARLEERRTGVPITAKVPTNGLLLDDDIIRRAGELGLFISLSFDGIQAAQDAGRLRLNGEGSFADAERGLRLLLRSGQPFGVYSVITPANVCYLAESRRWLWDRGVRILVSAIDYTADWGEEALATLAHQYQLLAELYDHALGQRAYSHLEPFDSRIGARTHPADQQRCCPGLHQLTVAPDGTLYGCVEYFYRRLRPLGTVATWLDAEAVKELARSRSGKAAECLDCGLRDRCVHTCDCVNLRTTGQPNRPARALCLAEQTTLQAVDRVATRLFRQRHRGFLVKHYSDSYSLLTALERYLNDLEVDHERLTTC
jgi:uncharacterized protein